MGEAKHRAGMAQNIAGVMGQAMAQANTRRIATQLVAHFEGLTDTEIAATLGLLVAILHGETKPPMPINAYAALVGANAMAAVEAVTHHHTIEG